MIQVRKSTYRGRDGWKVCGRPAGDPYGRSLAIFCEHEKAARHIATKIRRNPRYQTTAEDFVPIEMQPRWSQCWAVTTHGRFFMQGGSTPARRGMTRAEALATMPKTFQIFTWSGERVNVSWCVGLQAKGEK